MAGRTIFRLVSTQATMLNRSLFARVSSQGTMLRRGLCPRVSSRGTMLRRSLARVSSPFAAASRSVFRGVSLVTVASVAAIIVASGAATAQGLPGVPEDPPVRANEEPRGAAPSADQPGRAVPRDDRGKAADGVDEETRRAEARREEGRAVRGDEPSAAAAGAEPTGPSVRADAEDFVDVVPAPTEDSRRGPAQGARDPRQPVESPRAEEDLATLEFPEPVSKEGREAIQQSFMPVPYWRRGKPRLFTAVTLDLGFQYLRPRVSVGWGKPHYFWAGLDTNPILSASATGGYTGLRFSNPYVDLRAGGFYFYSFRHFLLPVQDSYTTHDIERRRDRNSAYFAAESELTTTLPVGPGTIISEYAVARVFGVPDDNYVFLETQRVVAAPPMVYRVRQGYGLAFGPTNALQIAPVAEVLLVPDRDATIVRGGLSIRVRLFDDLQVRANLIPVLVSPDSLGIIGGDFGQLGVRWRLATGMPSR